MGARGGLHRLGSRLLVLLLGDRVRQFVLGHVRAAFDVELLGALVELFLAVAPRVDASVGLLGPLTGGRTALRGLLVRRPLLVLELPVVALFLGDVLDRRAGGPVRARLGVVLLVRAVERLLVGPLYLLGRTLERPG